LARNGFVTIAPDFFGFGGSDAPDSDVWWERFARPVQVLQLIASLPGTAGVDTTKVGIWAHSNGGQLALSVLEITGAEIPTSLWAPVSKPFPYSVLYFTDEFEDEGKYIRGELSRLERDYDVRDFSISDYFEKINAPIQIHQGAADDAVPYEWSEDLVAQLEENEVEVEYFEYAGADHNMVGSWDEVIRQDIEFFEEKLGN
jgi:dipeptidyl aminopeptidase/acylaminoacyl peptidase